MYRLARADVRHRDNIQVFMNMLLKPDLCSLLSSQLHLNLTLCS